MIKTSLVYIECKGKYLMLYRNKKKNDPNEGKWLGVGGKFEEGENEYECATREVFEETGIKDANLCRVGLIHFRSDKYEDEDMYLFTGLLDDFVMLPGTNEGELAWIEKEKIMGLSLWEGDKVFLKDLTEGRKSINYTLKYSGDELVCIEKEG